jgi:hypothetical protein
MLFDFILLGACGMLVTGIGLLVVARLLDRLNRVDLG